MGISVVYSWVVVDRFVCIAGVGGMWCLLLSYSLTAATVQITGKRYFINGFDWITVSQSHTGFHTVSELNCQHFILAMPQELTGADTNIGLSSHLLTNVQKTYLSNTSILFHICCITNHTIIAEHL